SGSRVVSGAREGRDRRQPDHQELRRLTDPGTQRPVRALSVRWRTQRQDSEGPRAGIADAGRSAATDGGNRQAGAQGLRAQECGKEDRGEKSGREESGSQEGTGEESRGQEGDGEKGDGQEDGCQESRQQKGSQQRVMTSSGTDAWAYPESSGEQSPRGGT